VVADDGHLAGKGRVVDGGVGDGTGLADAFFQNLAVHGLAVTQHRTYEPQANVMDLVPPVTVMAQSPVRGGRCAFVRSVFGCDTRAHGVGFLSLNLPGQLRDLGFMYQCKIIELPSSNIIGFPGSAGMGIAAGQWVIWGDQTIFNQDLQPIHPVPEKIVYGPQCTEQGIWLNEEGKKYDTCSSKLISPDGDVLEKQRSPVFGSGIKIPGGSIRIEQFHRYDNAYLVRSDYAGQIIKKEFLAYVRGGRMSFVCQQSHVFVRDGSGNLICFDFELNELWRHATNKQISSRCLVNEAAMVLDDLVIFNLGESYDDEHASQSDFEIVGFHAASGTIAWRHVLAVTKPENTDKRNIDQRYGTFTMAQLFGNKVYLCLYGRLIRLDGKTGAVELDTTIPYQTFDGKPFGVSHVYPVAQGLLCFNRRGHQIELRSADAQTILQTIELQHGFCPDSMPLEHQGQLYFSLLHQNDFENYIKLAFATLTPDASAPAVLRALAEGRPPTTVEKIKDGRKFGNLVRIGGDDASQILRYGEIVLRELAFRQGWSTRMPELNEPEAQHNGVLHLQIDYSALQPAAASEADWLKKFGVIQERVSACLTERKLRTGNRKGFYAVSISVAPSATALAGLPTPPSAAQQLATATFRVNSKAHFSSFDMAALLTSLSVAGWNAIALDRLFAPLNPGQTHTIDHWRLIGTMDFGLDLASLNEDQLQAKVLSGEMFAVDLKRETQDGFAQLCERMHGIRERNLFLDRVPAKVEKVLEQCRYHYAIGIAPIAGSSTLPELAEQLCHALWESLTALVGHARCAADYKSYQVVKQDRPALREAAMVLLRPLLKSDKKSIEELDAKKLLARIKTGLRERVLFYDPECINSSGDYSAVLQEHLQQVGLQHIITSVLDVVDSLKGTVTISFALRGVTQEWCFEQDSDWVDSAFYTKLVALVEAQTEGTLITKESSDQSMQSIFLERPIAAYLCEAGAAQILAQD
jgi:hypothetical protein